MLFKLWLWVVMGGDAIPLQSIPKERSSTNKQTKQNKKGYKIEVEYLIKQTNIYEKQTKNKNKNRKQEKIKEMERSRQAFLHFLLKTLSFQLS